MFAAAAVAAVAVLPGVWHRYMFYSTMDRYFH